MNIWAFQRKAKRESLSVLLIFIAFFYTIWLGAFELTKFFFKISSKTNHFYIFIIALFTVSIFMIRTRTSINNFLSSLSADFPDKNDLRHIRAKNIVEEVSAGAGISPPKLLIFQSYIKNGFSIKKGKENFVVLSEGLVGNLKRDELEGVIAHEIAHIVNGDTEIKTFISSMVASIFFMQSIMPVFGNSEDNSTKRARVNIRVGGRGATFVIALYLYFLLTYIFSLLVSTFISRKRETLADTKAVELTNNPLGLASALYIIGRDKISSFSSITNPAFNMLFLTNPMENSLDEKEGFFSDLFSTHPPLIKRIDFLLKLAKTDRKNFYAQMYKRRHKPDEKYYVEINGKYEGPLRMKEIKEKFKNIPLINVFNENFGRDLIFTRGEPSEGKCPRCGGDLTITYYEDVKVEKCNSCGGIIVPKKSLKKILIRDDYYIDFKEEKENFIKRVNKLRREKKGYVKPFDIDPSKKLKCPKCKREMVRLFINYTIPVAVDYCPMCGIYFFDKGELEIIQ